MIKPRILFAGVFHWNAGSSHMIAEYARVASASGCEVGVSSQLSRLDGTVNGHLPLVDDISWATHLVLVFEGRQFLSTQQRELCEAVPRQRRIIVDPDGHWGLYVTAGVDDNAGADTIESWHKLYADLSDLILQPRLNERLPDGAEFFSYFGMPDIHPLASDLPHPRALPYELQYVGANWWRWNEMTSLIRAAAAAQPPMRRIRVCGRWWTGAPHPDHLTATANVSGWMRDHGVEVAPPVPFGHVVSTMSQAAITPVLARPLLARMELLTPRMFETLASGSIPALSPDLGYLSALYGDDVELFLLDDDPADSLARMIREPIRYRERLATIQRRVHERFNYRAVLAELIRFTR
ncbi:glycosyltransferase [Streptomyces scabiei]|uniref:glycosyltransferase n=1 Tax=Streptomyces scabiei TaxID=1930 RepID=UPI0029A3C2F8|nr:glycosyltransferase [Streptomyces scabiei]MDX2531921.1 glycosyltransferase [Streptomyces scabiei]MDX2794227.1 glycosyltransferase [Streptomyces scabiei]MDX3822771.1 glycosyltransferase [Streptomyces scabiei]